VFDAGLYRLGFALELELELERVSKGKRLMMQVQKSHDDVDGVLTVGAGRRVY
jgi:hypothetical protein